ncbi:eCIS core domain-containing protein [Nitrospira sp. Nam74]
MTMFVPSQADQERRSAVINRTPQVERALKERSHFSLNQTIDASPRMVAQMKQLRSIFGEAAQLKGGPDEEELQMKADTAVPQHPAGEILQGKGPQNGVVAHMQGSPASSINRTGLPDNLKAGIEALSGFAMDDVRVHYNSSKPAQLQAFAYTQGTDIHVAPGQEQHLPHEAWHVVQQKQGRVQPTRQMKDGVAINDDAGLEHEADVIGAKALTDGGKHQSLVQRKCDACAEEDAGHAQHVVSRMPSHAPFQLVRNGIHAAVVQLSCYFFKNADCQGQRVYASSKHNFRDWATYNCSGERGGDDCVDNDGKGHCYCPSLQEEDTGSDRKPGTSGPLSAYDDPTTSRASKALIERGLLTGQYPPR